MYKRFTAVVIGVNMLIISVMFLSGASLLNSRFPPRVIINQFDFFTIVTSYYSAPGEPAIGAIMYTLYWPTYLFIIAVALNIVFIAKILLSKEKPQ
jgi:hypothetical protein